MGGFGSGRWRWHRRATSVETCRVFDLAAVTRGRVVAAGLAGSVRWERDGREVGSVGYHVAAHPSGALVLGLGYRVTPGGLRPGPPRDVRLSVLLEPAAMPRGGTKWWGMCPLSVGGVPCGRRVGKLYQPPGADLFGCRHCHQLAYLGSQTHDRRVDALVADPIALFALTRKPGRLGLPQLGLALSALTVLQKRADRYAARQDRRPARRRDAKSPRPRRHPRAPARPGC